MATLQELLAQQVELEKRIAEARKYEHADAVAKARALIDKFGLNQADLFGKDKIPTTKKTSGKVAAKYRNPRTGATWTGRGKVPRWLDGEDRSNFLIS